MTLYVIILRVLCTLWLIGCATSISPATSTTPAPTITVQLPQAEPTKLVMIVHALPPVGNVLPVQVAVTNLMPKWIKLDVQRIRAGETDGATVGVLAPDQAKKAAGGADKLIAELSKVYLVHDDKQQNEPSLEESVVAGCVAGPFALAPSLGPGALVICPIAVVGGIGTVISRSVKAASIASSSSLQVDDITLSGDRHLHPGDAAHGYIFLPVGDYTTIEMPVTDLDTGGLETIVQPWDSAAQLATEGPASPAYVPSGMKPEK